MSEPTPEPVLEEVRERSEAAKVTGTWQPWVDDVDALLAALTEALRERDALNADCEAMAEDRDKMLRQRDDVAALLAEGGLAVADQRERAECLRDDYDASQMRLHRAEAALTEAEHRADLAERVVEAARRLDWEKVALVCDSFDLFLSKFTPSDEKVAADMEAIRQNTDKTPPGDMMQQRIREFAAALAALDTTDGPGGTQ